MRKLIEGGTIVDEGRRFRGSIIIDGEQIADITDADKPRGSYDEIIDATGCLVIPGVIDEHVHFREPGMTEKADIETESRAAAWGGVTSFLEMPNTNPQTTTLEALADKMQRGQRESHVNYGFFFGATNNNSQLFAQLDRHRVPGIKLFMGASTGNMLVDRRTSLEAVFAEAARLDLPVMTHCEDTTLINANMRKAKAQYGDDPDIGQHWKIRSEEACWRSSSLAANLARQYGTRLHIAHISTEHELSLLGGRISGEACIAHLLFTNDDYNTLGALIKCNPSVKTRADRDALRRALADGTIYTVATDHAPHKLSQKQGGCSHAASGMPMVQFSLTAMLELVDEGVLTVEQLVGLMCHHPAELFHIDDRGFIRKGYKADITIVRPHSPWTVYEDCIQSKCKWSPLLGHEFNWRVEMTMCNGTAVYHRGITNDDYRGEALTFRSGE